MLRFYESINSLTEEINELKSREEVLKKEVLMNNSLLSKDSKFNRNTYDILTSFNSNFSLYNANDMNCVISILNCIGSEFSIIESSVVNFEYSDIFNREDSRSFLDIKNPFGKTSGTLRAIDNYLSNSQVILEWTKDYLSVTKGSIHYNVEIPSMMSLNAEEQIYVLSLLVIKELSLDVEYTDYSPEDISCIYNFCSLRIEPSLFSVNHEFINNTIIDISTDKIIVVYNGYVHVINNSVHNLYPISFYTLPTEVLYTISNVYQSILTFGDLNCALGVV